MALPRRTYLCLSEPRPRSMPGCTSPSFRPEAPSARSASFSTSRMSSFQRDSSRAMDTPEMPPPMMSTSGVLPSSASSHSDGRRMGGISAPVKVMSFTTWQSEAFVAAIWQARTTSSHASSVPRSTMQLSSSAACTRPPKALFSFRLHAEMFMSLPSKQSRPIDRLDKSIILLLLRVVKFVHLFAKSFKIFIYSGQFGEKGIE